MTLANFFEIDIPWGRWPWTIHSAGWGIVCNVAVCLLFSMLTQKRSRSRASHALPRLSRGGDRAAEHSRVWRPIAWVAALGWFFFADRAGRSCSASICSARRMPARGAWLFGIPSIWAWQIIAWALGVLLLWLLAYRLGLSRPPSHPVEPEAEAIRGLGQFGARRL